MKVVALGEVVEIKGGGTPSKDVPEYWDGNIPWASVKDFKDITLGVTVDRISASGVRNSATQIIPAGNILVPTRMAVGKAAVNLIDMAINQDLKAIIPGPKVTVRYLLHALLANAKKLEDQATGATVKGIKLNALRTLEIPLPPLEEQKRIAAILDQADALRRLRARALDRLNSLGQAIFHEMFGRKTSAPLKRIAEFAEVKGGKRLPKGSDYSDEVTAHPYIRVSDLGDLKIDTAAIKYISPDIQRSIWRYTVSSGDVVISIAGTIGLTAAVPETLNGANLTENAAKITPKKGGEFDPTYLAWALSMPEAKSQILANTGQVTIGKLALFRIEQIEVPMPTIEHQRAFSQALRKMNSTSETASLSEKELNSLFASLQHRAFRGEL